MKKKYNVSIAPEECKGCGRCIIACPRGVFAVGKHLNHMGFPAVERTQAECIGCSICYYTCPEPGALTIVEEVEVYGTEQ